MNNHGATQSDIKHEIAIIRQTKSTSKAWQTLLHAPKSSSTLSDTHIDLYKICLNTLIEGRCFNAKVLLDGCKLVCNLMVWSFGVVMESENGRIFCCVLGELLSVLISRVLNKADCLGEEGSLSLGDGSRFLSHPPLSTTPLPPNTKDEVITTIMINKLECNLLTIWARLYHLQKRPDFTILSMQLIEDTNRIFAFLHSVPDDDTSNLKTAYKCLVFFLHHWRVMVEIEGSGEGLEAFLRIQRECHWWRHASTKNKTENDELDSKRWAIFALFLQKKNLTITPNDLPFPTTSSIKSPPSPLTIVASSMGDEAVFRVLECVGDDAIRRLQMISDDWSLVDCLLFRLLSNDGCDVIEANCMHMNHANTHNKNTAASKDRQQPQQHSVHFESWLIKHYHHTQSKENKHNNPTALIRFTRKILLAIPLIRRECTVSLYERVFLDSFLKDCVGEEKEELCLLFGRILRGHHHFLHTSNTSNLFESVVERGTLLLAKYCKHHIDNIGNDHSWTLTAWRLFCILFMDPFYEGDNNINIKDRVYSTLTKILANIATQHKHKTPLRSPAAKSPRSTKLLHQIYSCLLSKYGNVSSVMMTIDHHSFTQTNTNVIGDSHQAPSKSISTAATTIYTQLQTLSTKHIMKMKESINGTISTNLQDGHFLWIMLSILLKFVVKERVMNDDWSKLNASLNTLDLSSEDCCEMVALLVKDIIYIAVIYDNPLAITNLQSLHNKVKKNNNETINVIIIQTNQSASAVFNLNTNDINQATHIIRTQTSKYKQALSQLKQESNEKPSSSPSPAALLPLYAKLLQSIRVLIVLYRTDGDGLMERGWEKIFGGYGSQIVGCCEWLEKGSIPRVLLVENEDYVLVGLFTEAKQVQSHLLAEYTKNNKPSANSHVTDFIQITENSLVVDCDIARLLERGLHCCNPSEYHSLLSTLLHTLFIEKGESVEESKCDDDGTGKVMFSPVQLWNVLLNAQLLCKYGRMNTTKYTQPQEYNNDHNVCSAIMHYDHEMEYLFTLLPTDRGGGSFTLVKSALPLQHSLALQNILHINSQQLIPSQQPQQSNNTDEKIKRDWWSERWKLEKQFKEWIEEIGECVLGDVYLLIIAIASCNGDNFCNNQNDYGNSKSRLRNLVVNAAQTHKMIISKQLQEFLSAKNNYNDTAAEDNPFDSAAAIVESDGFGADGSTLICLLVDCRLQRWPWECIFPNIALIRTDYPLSLLPNHLSSSSSAYKTTQTTNAPATKFGTLLNPSADLLRTQQTLLPLLQKPSLCNPLVSGRAPAKREIGEFERNRCFFYFGHGSGRRWWRDYEEEEDGAADGKSTKIRIPKNRVGSGCTQMFMFGCSSMAIKGDHISPRTTNAFINEPHPNPKIERIKNVCTEWMACRLIIANLWDVTDIDHDKFAITLLSKLGIFTDNHRPPHKTGEDQFCVHDGDLGDVIVNDGHKLVELVRALKNSRSACRLPCLNGASPIIHICNSPPQYAKSNKTI